MSTISPIHGEEGRKLLDIIDNLRLLPSISHEIALPQIVVVGQQSSGKSSVLKAISNINFPTNSGFCTQFATEIVCRREAQENTTAQIIPASTIDDHYRARLEAFSKRWSHIPKNQDISRIIDSAKQVMGLNQHQRISKDKLRLEFSGPNQDHISLIDLPGLFEQELPGQRENDKRLVDEMVTEYISGGQTIILAVVSGAYDLQVQRIFRMFEPHKHRTLGVVTAPDLIESGTTRAATFSKLVANSSFKAGYGWHVLRSLSHREEQEGKVRDEVEEAFFANQTPNSGDMWATMPSSRLGIHNLKVKLAGMLQNKIAEDLPQIQRQLRNALAESRRELNVLGDERITTEQQRDYVADKSEALRSYTKTQLHGGSGVKSLRSQIRNVNDRFADDMINFGASYEFVNTLPEKLDHEHGAGDDANIPVKISKQQWLTLMLDEIWNSRGQELDGLVDPVWVGRMFLRQCCKWTRIAEDHLETAFAIVEQYFINVMEAVVRSEDAPRFLQHVVQPELNRRYLALKQKLTEVLTPYSTENIRTLNRKFRARQQEPNTLPFAGADQNTLTKDMIFHYTTVMDEYYHLALTIFVDNVESLVIENVLLGGLEDIMTATKAYRMSEADIAQLAAESKEVIEKRGSLTTRVRDYEEGSRILSRYVIRCQLPTEKPQARIIPPAVSLTPKPAANATTVAVPPTTHQPDPTQYLSPPSIKVSSDGNDGRERQARRTIASSNSSRESSVTPRVFSDDENELLSSAPSSANSTPAKIRVKRNKFEARAGEEEL